MLNEQEALQCSRFKEMRKKLKIKQGDLAKELAISQGHASDIENGRKTVSDRIMEILALKYNISKEWIETGNGEMFVPKTRSETIASFAGSLMKEEEESFKRRLVEALAELDEEEWEMLEKLAQKLANKKD